MNKGKNQTKVFVLAHDAGGAEILGAFIRKNKMLMHFTAYTGGPARAVFKRLHIPSNPEPHRKELRAIIAKYVGMQALLGTGGPHSVELATLKEAKRQGMKTVAYVDSWINYRERFGYPSPGWQKNLPDEIWAGDARAFSLARTRFPNTHVRLVPNQYFSNILGRYRALAPHNRRTTDVLFMSSAGRASENLLAGFLTECARCAIDATVRVRMHPEDSQVRYDRIIDCHSSVRVKLSHEKDIVHDLLRAWVVVGPETNALVPACMLGIKTIRIVPKGEKPFLPFKQISTVRNARDAVHKIDF